MCGLSPAAHIAIQEEELACARGERITVSILYLNGHIFQWRKDRGFSCDCQRPARRQKGQQPADEAFSVQGPRECCRVG